MEKINIGDIEKIIIPLESDFGISCQKGDRSLELSVPPLIIDGLDTFEIAEALDGYFPLGARKVEQANGYYIVEFSLGTKSEEIQSLVKKIERAYKDKTLKE